MESSAAIEYHTYRTHREIRRQVKVGAGGEGGRTGDNNGCSWAKEGRAAATRRTRIPLAGERPEREGERERATHVEGAKAIFSGRQISPGPPTSPPSFVVGATLFQGATKKGCVLLALHSRCVSHYRAADTPGTNDPPTVPPIPLLSPQFLLCLSLPPPLSSSSLMGRAREFV